MAKSEQQRQKKLAKKKSKERESHLQLARKKAQLSSMAGQVAAASGPPSVCLVSDACTNGVGIGGVLIARPIPRGQTVMVIFLLDMFCLGVKDVVFQVGGPANLRALIEKMEGTSEMRPIAPGECRSLVEAAVHYAEGLGLPPHSDYRKVVGIFEGIEPLPLPEKFQFGKDGKPVYVSGPFDSDARQNMIFRALAKSVGEGNFDFTIGTSSLGSNSFAGLAEARVYDSEDDDDYNEQEEDEDEEVSMNVIEGRVVDSSTR